MSRSLKKGPFVDGSLLKKVEAAQASRDKRPGLVARQFFLNLSV